MHLRDSPVEAQFRTELRAWLADAVAALSLKRTWLHDTRFGSVDDAADSVASRVGAAADRRGDAP
jgi:hypothetical protein